MWQRQETQEMLWGLKRKMLNMDEKTSERVAELRSKGLPASAIARQVGLRPAQVSELIRQQAAQREACKDANALPALHACYVSPGWSVGLGLSGAAEAWRRYDQECGGAEGLVTVLWVRTHRYGRLQASGCLVDVYCLGVKDALGPKSLQPDELRPFVARYFSTYDAPPVEVPLELAQSLVLGAVDYAATLGFEPHADLAAVRPLLGSWEGPSPIRFGRDGRPYYIQGPHDDAFRVLQTLRRAVGDGGFASLMGAEPAELALP